ncbi:protein kinase domain-containing protein [Planctomycetaceae bacterium SH139]
MNSSGQAAIRTLDSVLDGFEECVNRSGVDQLDLVEFVSNWQAVNQSVLPVDVYVELLRVWMEYKFQAGSLVSVESALGQFPGIEFQDSARSILEFERQRLGATWSVHGEAAREVRKSLPTAPGSWEDFDLLADLGEGAFARVFLARQTGMANRLVALKITARKTRESQWLARLQHSAIVPIYSVHQAGNLFGVCMPYLGNTTLADLLSEQPEDVVQSVGFSGATHSRPTAPTKVDLLSDGKSLLTKLRERQSHLDTAMRNSQTTAETRDLSSEAGETRRRGAVSENVRLEVTSASTEIQERTSTARELSSLDYVESVAWIGAQLANALEHAHRLGIIHCDIKPANVLLAADGQPRLLDFNVAQEPLLERGNQVEGTIAEGNPVLIGGTPGYMAPEHVELLNGKHDCRLDGRADIFALGVVLFELLARRRPGKRELSAVTAANFRRMLRTENPKVTPAMAAIVAKCVVADREERYSTATELYEDLYAHVHHRPLVHQPEPSLLERCRKWRRRHPQATSVGSILAMATVLILLMSIWGIRQRDSKRLLALELDQRALQVELAAALPRVSAAREYSELRGEVLRDTRRIAEILGRLAPQPFFAERLNERLSPAARLQLLTYTRLFQLSGRAGQEPSRGSGPEVQGGVAGWQLPPVLASFHSANTAKLRLPKLYEAYLAGDYTDVIVRHRRGADLADGDFARWLFVGHSFLQLQQWADAAEAYTYALAISPDLSIARFYRGICRMKAERWEEAAEDFAIVKSQQPALMETRFNLAQVQKQLGQFDKAEAELTAAIDLGWKRVMGYYTRASIRKRLGNVEAAKGDFSMAVKIAPVSEADWLQLGLLALRSDAHKAEQYFRACLARFPNSRIARQNLAHVLGESLNQTQEAVEVLDELITMGKPLPEYYSGRAVLHAREERMGKALADLRAAEQLNPQVPLVQYQLACGYSLLAGLRSGELEQSVRETTEGALRDLAIDWYSRAVRSEARLRQLAETDHDLDWLRTQPDFALLQQAFATIDLAMEHE